MARSLEGASHLEWRHDLDGFLFFLRAVRYTATAKPALFRICYDRRFSFFRIRRQRIAHTNINTSVASRADIFIEIDMFETHFNYPPPLSGLRFELLTPLNVKNVLSKKPCQ
jgi:hypothetical protein